jgi:hypothetical protein
MQLDANQPDRLVDIEDTSPSDTCPSATDIVFDGGWGEVGGVLADFCVGSKSKVFYLGQTYTAPVTSKWTDPFLSCCMVYAARLHVSQVLGNDFEVVFRVSVGMDVASILPVGIAGSRVVATLRTNPAATDAGLAADPIMTGSVYISARPFGSDPFTLGACVSVDDPASPLAGTRVYVPGVRVAPGNWGKRLRFLPLKDPSITASSITKEDLQALELGTEPLLDLMDIDFVDFESKTCGAGGESTCQWVGLYPGFASGKTLASQVKSPLLGMPFVVEADGQRIYLGSFLSLISSYRPSMPWISIEDLRADGFSINPPPPSSSAWTDLRRDPRIVQVLTEAGKINSN